MPSAACTLNPKVAANKYYASLEDTVSRKTNCHMRRTATAPHAAAGTVSGFTREGENRGFPLSLLHNAFLPPVSHTSDMPKTVGYRQKWKWNTPHWAAAQTTQASAHSLGCWMARQQMFESGQNHSATEERQDQRRQAWVLVDRWKGSSFSLPDKRGLQDKSGWKGPQEVPSPTSYPKQGQLCCQTRLLSALSSWVLKTPKDACR